MSAIYSIDIEARDPTRPLINNLFPHFGQSVSEVIDLRNLVAGSASAATDVLAGTSTPTLHTARSLASTIGLGLKFVTTTAIVFTGLFVAFNWGAYSQKFSYWYRSINPNAGKTVEQTLLASVLDHDKNIYEAKAFEETVKGDSGTDVDFHEFDIAPSKDYLVIPKLGLTVPIVSPDDSFLVKEDWDGFEKQIQENLQNGVVHYPGTAMAGQRGNTIITGHSSYYLWDAGRYKDVFALLPELKVGDEVAVWHSGVRYVYKAFDIETVAPENTSVLKQTGNEYDSMLTLLTCVPVGTAKDRLLVKFQQVYPDPVTNTDMDGEVVIGGMLKA